jgi:hypothetical protein
LVHAGPLDEECFFQNNDGTMPMLINGQSNISQWGCRGDSNIRLAPCTPSQLLSIASGTPCFSVDKAESERQQCGSIESKLSSAYQALCMAMCSELTILVFLAPVLKVRTQVRGWGLWAGYERKNLWLLGEYLTSH